MSPRLRKACLAPVAIALAIACGIGLSRLVSGPQPVTALEWLDAPRPVAAFQLASDTGAFTNHALQGQWQLLALGFTHCPDICPATLSQLAALQSALPGRRLRVMFVSVDPARDTPPQLAHYVSFFGADIVGVTGSDTELRRLAQSLGMDFRREEAAGTATVSHSPTIALIGPDGAMHARLRPGFDTQQAARELAGRIGADA